MRASSRSRGGSPAATARWTSSARASVSRCPATRCTTLRTFTSTAARSAPSAWAATASAVYRPTPGSSVRSSGQPSAAIRVAASHSRRARRG
ncbi:MAG: hypothetical protein M5U14_16855 [Acidimicrobiia bacterium]|nr:hypothetical protein [Acidimicrobiia bacterium]